jgi:hypothetical protein
MDPFIESQKWKAFHGRFITHLGDALVARLRPRYVIDTEDYIYVATPDGEEHTIAPDLTVIDTDRSSPLQDPSIELVGDQVPLLLTLPRPAPIRQRTLIIRAKESQNVVTVIELLSPWNKTPSTGLGEYLTKRETVLQSDAHLVEIDLLRGGRRLPTIEPLPEADYFAFICRRELNPRVETYRWSIRDRLPKIPIPLSAGDADAPLDLQAVFTETYDKAGYDYALDYSREIDPPVSDGDAAWVRERVRP